MSTEHVPGQALKLQRNPILKSSPPPTAHPEKKKLFSQSLIQNISISGLQVFAQLPSLKGYLTVITDNAQDFCYAQHYQPAYSARLTTHQPHTSLSY